MQHKGEIIEKAVRLSGFPITKLAKRIGKTPRWVYYLFESKDVALDYILKIGEIIHYDFSTEIKELQRYKNEVTLKQDVENQSSEIEHWKNKYLELLEKYNQLLESNFSTKNQNLRPKTIQDFQKLLLLIFSVLVPLILTFLFIS